MVMSRCCCCRNKKSFKSFKSAEDVEQAFCEKLFRRPTVRELTRANTQYHQSLKYTDPKNTLNTKNKNQTVLRRVFTLPTLVFFAISGTIGSGIYIICGSAGKDYAGAGLIFSISIAGFVALTNGLVIAEFASRVPLIGGDYTYALCSSGEFIGFILGWFSLTREPLGNAISAVAVTYYLYTFLDAMDIINSDWGNSYWFGYDDGDIFSFNIVAPILVIISGIFVYCGITVNKRLLTIVAIWNMSLLLLFGFSGLFLFKSDVMTNPCDHTEYGNECPEDAKNAMLPYGGKGMMTAAAIAFWSFLGPETIVYIAEECVNPMRDIPRAMYISYALVFLLYTFVVTVFSGMIPFQSFDVRAPLAQAFAAHDEKLLMGLSSIGALTAITGVFFQSGVGAPRIYLRLAIDGMIPKFCKVIHRKYRTPTGGILYFFAMVLIASATLDLGFLLELYSSLTLILMGLTQCSLLVMRYSPPALMNNNNEGVSPVFVSPSFTPETPPKTTVYITSFWTHNKVLSVIYSYFMWTGILCVVVVQRDEFFDNDHMGIWIFLVIVFCILWIMTTTCIIYFHCKWNWLECFTEYEKKKIFWMPFGPYLNLFAIGVDLYLLSLLLPRVYYEAFTIMVVGLLFYFGYSYRHSHFRPQHKKLIMRSRSI
eukprot:121128_1